MSHLKSMLLALKEGKVYFNLKKCCILKNKLLFVGYIVSMEGIHVDEEKVKEIRDWLTQRMYLNCKVSMS